MNNILPISEVAEIHFGNSKDHPSDGFGGEFYLGKRETTQRKPDNWRRVNTGADLSASTRVQLGDVVMPLVGDLEQPFLVREQHVGSILGKDCTLLRPIKGKGVLSEWILAWARSGAFRNQVAELRSGSSVKYVPVKAIGSLRIPLAEPEKQNRMAMQINAADQVVDNLENLRDELKMLQQLKVDLAFYDAF